MKCPNCGMEMQEDRLYCEACGEDIHMVPDFDPELELNMQEGLEQVLENVAVETEVQAESEHQRKWTFFSGGIAAIVSVLAVILVLMNVIAYFSPEYQADKAQQAVRKEQYDRAIKYFERAIELDQQNIALKFELAEVYFLKNNKIEYEYVLSQIVGSPYTNAEQLESAYGKLIAIYKARGDYKSIHEMLLKCGSESIRNSYQVYLALPPEFSALGGRYDSVVALKLTVTGKGQIFYTLDGTEPDENSLLYRAPILMEKGHYIVKAVFRNENGVYSEIVKAEYDIEAEDLEVPELNVDSGDYSIPVNITVLNDKEDVYYTLDGTEPTIMSYLYTEPIPMPLGDSIFRFARLENGRSTIVVDRAFHLELETDFTPEQAVLQIAEYSISTGKIRDGSGHFDDTEAVYQYQYLYVTNINQVSDYYVVAEILADVQGIPARTGNYFAVDVYTGDMYKLQMKDDICTLTKLENNPSWVAN